MVNLVQYSIILIRKIELGNYFYYLVLFFVLSLDIQKSQDSSGKGRPILISLPSFHPLHGYLDISRGDYYRERSYAHS